MQRRTLWYTRRDGVVRGPYPDRQISRYILLGRIRAHDEVCPEGGDWAPLAHHAELVPEVMTLPPTEENLQKLLMARMRADERQPRDRRDQQAPPSPQIRNRRSGKDRRRGEEADALCYRELRAAAAQAKQRNQGLYRYPLTLAALVIAGLGLSYLLNRVQPPPVPPDCEAGARPGVNWNGCNLIGQQYPSADLVGANLRNVRLDAADLSGATMTGVDLQYASLNGGRLRNVDLSHARLVGVAAHGADLRFAHLNYANLAYANLSDARLEGADLTGADLSHAIWVDHRPCLAGSVGGCNQPR